MVKKQPSIRLRESDISVYSKLANSAKSKINRTRKNYDIDLSNEIEIPKLENIKTRKHFNEVVEKLSSFTNRYNLRYQFRKNEYNVVASVAEINATQRAVKKEQRLHDQVAKKYVGNNETAKARKEFLKRPSDVGFNRPKDFDFGSIRSRRALDRRKQKAIERGNIQYYDKRLVTMKENYISMLESAFNSDADDVIKKLKDIPPDDFYEIYLQNFIDFDFNEFYITEMMGEDHTLPLKEMERHLDRYFQGGVNLDLKGF